MDEEKRGKQQAQIYEKNAEAAAGQDRRIKYGLGFSLRQRYKLEPGLGVSVVVGMGLVGHDQIQTRTSDLRTEKRSTIGWPCT